MKIRILWIGKAKERYAAEGIEVYLAKLKPFVDVKIVEIKEHKGLPTELALQKEGERILKQTSAFILFDERGKQMTSPAFAAYLKERSQMDFVIGGPFGVSREVRDKAGDIISLSPMTLNHEMVRLVALEQLYRAVMINTGRSYHH